MSGMGRNPISRLVLASRVWILLRADEWYLWVFLFFLAGSYIEKNSSTSVPWSCPSVMNEISVAGSSTNFFRPDCVAQPVLFPCCALGAALSSSRLFCFCLIFSSSCSSLANILFDLGVGSAGFSSSSSSSSSVELSGCAYTSTLFSRFRSAGAVLMAIIPYFLVSRRGTCSVEGYCLPLAVTVSCRAGPL